MKVSMDSKNKLMVWKALDELSLHDATLLMFGIAPEGKNYELLRGKMQSDWPENMLTIVHLLSTKLDKGELEGKAVHYMYDENVIDIYESVVSVQSLKKLLKEKNIIDCFFNDEALQENYLDPKHECYAPKLAAAVRAWTHASTHPEENGTPKQRIERWLRHNAADFGLQNEDGTFNAQAIEEISKVGNWQPQGGAAKTPSTIREKTASSSNSTSITISPWNPPTPNQGNENKEENKDWDTLIPF